MSSTRVPAALRRRVQERAAGCCEYCLLSEVDAYFSHEPDHIIADKHGGETTLENLAWSCFDCNRFKGSDIASKDPMTGTLVSLFNPRIDRWHEHFEVELAAVLQVSLDEDVNVPLARLLSVRGFDSTTCAAQVCQSSEVPLE